MLLNATSLINSVRSVWSSSYFAHLLSCGLRSAHGQTLHKHLHVSDVVQQAGKVAGGQESTYLLDSTIAAPLRRNRQLLMAVPLLLL